MAKKPKIEIEDDSQTLVSGEPVSLDREAIDIVKVDGDYKKVLVSYNLETGEGKVTKVSSLGDSQGVAVTSGSKYFSQKLILGRFVEKGGR